VNHHELDLAFSPPKRICQLPLTPCFDRGWAKIFPPVDIAIGDRLAIDHLLARILKVINWRPQASSQTLR
jgi:hypothetical protein